MTWRAMFDSPYTEAGQPAAIYYNPYRSKELQHETHRNVTCFGGFNGWSTGRAAHAK